MLDDEERKAIENLKIEYEKPMKEDNILFPLYKSDAKRLIDIIEKQSKEIEELKMITKEYDTFLGNEKIIIADKSYFDNGYFKEKFISKDKIKAKIEVMNTNIVNAEKFDCDYIGQCRFAKYILQSLLEKE